MCAKKVCDNGTVRNESAILNGTNGGTNPSAIEPQWGDDGDVLTGDNNGDENLGNDGNTKHDGNDEWGSDDEEDEEEAQATRELTLKLQKAVPAFFPPAETTEAEETSLCHYDLSWSNILATDDGMLTAILDWECTTTIPSWKACQLPEFLVGRPREDLALRAAEVMLEGLSEEKAAEWVKEQGWQDTFHEEWAIEWDQTRLTEVFKQEMERVAPEWMRVYEALAMKRGIDLAVSNCNEELYRRRIHRWLENAMGEKPYRRIQSIFEGEKDWGE
jgi:Phosphotransferase enzyme family